MSAVRLRGLCLASLLVLVVCASTVTAQTAQAKHSQVGLLSQRIASPSGAELRLGVHFILEPGWHIYWTNPGDSGQPPVFKWQLPAGFSAGEIQWPRPNRMQSSPQMAD